MTAIEQQNMKEKNLELKVFKSKKKKKNVPLKKKLAPLIVSETLIKIYPDLYSHLHIDHLYMASRYEIILLSPFV